MSQLRQSIFDPSLRAEPFPLYQEILRAPVFWDDQIPGGAWIVARHADVAKGFRDPRLSADRMPIFRMVFRDTDEARAFDDSMSRWLLNLDPPRHPKLRALVSKAFAPRIVSDLKPRIQAITNRLLDSAAEAGGTMDLMRDFALPLPVTIIAQLLGLPLDDVARLRTWSNDIAFFFGSMRGIKRAMAADVSLREYLLQMIEARRANPGADLLSALIVAEESGETLSEADIVSTCILLFIAGHETTTHLIGNGLLALLQHPNELALLREDPSRTEAAVDELLRFGAIVPFIGRVAREDLELGGQRIEKGQFVLLILGAANRDPAVFPDPDKLDITRRDVRHLAFGHGIHFCVGAQLARVEAAIAFDTLLRRFPNLRLGAEPPVWQENIGLRGLSSFPLTLG